MVAYTKPQHRKKEESESMNKEIRMIEHNLLVFKNLWVFSRTLCSLMRVKLNGFKFFHHPCTTEYILCKNISSIFLIIHTLMSVI